MLELVIIVAIIALLFIFMGAQVYLLIFATAIILALFTALLLIAFFYCTIKILRGKRTDAEFVRIDKDSGGRFSTAYYKIGEDEYPCFFPAEVVGRKKIYVEGKPCKVILDRKKERVFDRNALVTCIVGDAAGAALTVMVVSLVINML